MYELDKAAFGHFLAQLRREKGMTQKELAATLYVSDKAVSKWERGLSVPDISLLEPLDAALELPLRRRMQAKLWQALYFKFDYEKEYLPQLEENLVWLGAELQKLTDYQQRRNTYRKK